MAAVSAQSRVPTGEQMAAAPLVGYAVVGEVVAAAVGYAVVGEVAVVAAAELERVATRAEWQGVAAEGSWEASMEGVTEA